MKEINDGGQAFPVAGGQKIAIGNDLRKTLPSNGISKRDYFAAKAMQACNSNGSDYHSWADLAADAYEIADAMIAEGLK